MKVEVKEAQSNEVDWTKNPQLLYSKNENTIVMTIQTTEETNRTFYGVVMYENHIYKHGFFSEWNKKDFTPFHGEITLKND